MIGARATSPLEKYRIIAFTSMKDKLRYRGNFAASLVTYALFVFIFSRIWAAAYSGQGGIAGYDYRMSVWYFIIAEVSVFGFGRFFWNLAEDIKSGQVVYFLSRPYSFVGYHFSHAMGRGVLDAGFIFLEGLAVGFLLAGSPPDFALWRLCLVIVSLLIAGCLQFFVQMSIAMTAFWVEENSAFFWIFQKFALIIGTFVPIEFLPGWAQRAAWWTPLPSLNYAPARILVAASPAEAAGLIAAQLAWVGMGVLATRLIFDAGRSKLTIQGG